MSTFVYLDSKFRNDTNELPSFYHIYTEQTINWPLNPRTISLVADSMYNQQPDFLSSVELLELMIFYDGVPPEPFVKVNFSNIEFNDVFLINTIDDQNDLKFIARQQKDYLNGWVRYTSEMTQNMRYKRKGSFVFKVINKDNAILNTGNHGRLTALFSIKPFSLNYYPIQTRNIP
jgi:hypothetical protein